MSSIGRMDKIKAKQKKIEEQQQAGRNPQPPEGAEGMAAAGGELVTYVALGAHPSLVAWKQNIQWKLLPPSPHFSGAMKKMLFCFQRGEFGGADRGCLLYLSQLKRGQCWELALRSQTLPTGRNQALQPLPAF